MTNETACGSWSLATEAANAPGGARSSGGAGGGRFQTAPSTVKRDESAGEAQATTPDAPATTTPQARQSAEAPAATTPTVDSEDAARDQAELLLGGGR